MRHLLLCFLAITSLWGNPAQAQDILADQSAAVILAYYRIGEDEYPGSNLRTEQFAQQIAELAGGDYKVLPVPEIIKALQSNTPLPERTIGITFQGGYKSFVKNALPLLEQYQLPFTVFFNPAQAEHKNENYLDWQDLKALQSNPRAGFGLISAAPFSGAQDQTAILEGINRARLSTREKLGLETALFAYPQGAYNRLYHDLLKEQGFEAAFGLQSGVAHKDSDMFAIPRFTMTESYGDLERFQMVTYALPLPVSGIEPPTPLLETQQPLIGFTLDDALAAQAGKLSCFMSGAPDAKTEHVSQTRIELRAPDPLLEDRVRVNCTIPVDMKPGEDIQRWRWFGMLLFNTAETILEEDEP